MAGGLETMLHLGFRPLIYAVGTTAGFYWLFVRARDLDKKDRDRKARIQRRLDDEAFGSGRKTRY